MLKGRVQTATKGASPTARTPPQAGGHAQAQSRPPGPSRVGHGNQLSAGAALLSGVAEDLREVGPPLCTGHVCRAVVPSGCERWRDDRADQRLARTTLQTCLCGRIKKKARSERWQVCPCGTCAQRDLFSAYLARFVDPETSLLDTGQARATWPGWEPTLQAAYEQAISNQPARGRRLPAAFGRPPVDPSQMVACTRVAQSDLRALKCRAHVTRAAHRGR